VTTVEEEFVGYLLNALDPVTHRRVENYLAAHPESREQLEILRQALEPLELDREDEAPPHGLSQRTLARVAEHACRRLPQAPPEPSRLGGSGRNWWRRADVLVAASVALFVMLLTPPVLSKVRNQYQVAACQNNLGVLGRALLTFSETHQGKFPNVADEKPPYNVAGMVIPVLYEAGVLGTVSDLRCPGDRPTPPLPLTASQLKALPVEEFLDKVPFLSGPYSYSLGYRQGGAVRGMFQDAEQPPAVSPLMADAPLYPLSDANSANHGGAGQNVLFMDGHVAFCSHRLVGYQRDDIYRSRANKVEAGVNRYDAVLGSSAACP
jgi:prepilin-type processing-associated H-X9-DG protein